ncbi:ADP-ribosylation factor GTPase-activating protein 1 [Hortaea werneckii]|nr:ADP-ribosylation factor GTPase-activating protein 1 [Hortaea werneckii]
MSKMWEVDPETRSKLLEIQKQNENNKCVDCGAPSPQWISPKLGIFFCLACSGIHRSLGVHISFVRSATMDALKTGEVKRMELGGNKPWKDFFDSHSTNTLIGRTFDECTIAERYDSEAGEEWKERLTAKVEDREYVPGTSKPATASASSQAKKASVEDAPNSSRNSPAASGRNTPQSHSASTQKQKNEAYFARMGSENAQRSADLPPSQGGKYSGFGSGPPPTSSSSNNNGWQDDFQKDPLSSITKGLGWLGSNFSKQAINVNKAYIQPGMKSFQEGDFASNAQRNLAGLGNTAQSGLMGLGEQFNRFVDPEHENGGTNNRAGGGSNTKPEKADFWDSFGQAPSGPPQEKRGFWDDFASAGEQAAQQKQQQMQGAGSGSTSIGTSAMKAGGPAGQGAAARKEEGDGWGDW